MPNSRSIRIFAAAAIGSALAGASPAISQTDQAPSATTSSTFQRHVTKVGDQEFVVEIRDGEIAVARLNGEDIPLDRIRRVGGDVFHIQMPEGDASVTIDLSAGRRGAQGYGFFDRRTASIVVNGPHGDPFIIDLPSAPIGAWGDNFTFLFEEGSGEQAERQPAMPAAPPKVMIGVQMNTPSAELAGHLGIDPGETTLVAAVYPDLPAAAAGLEPYDVIIAVNGQKPADGAAVLKALADAEPGGALTLTVLHRGEQRDIEITPAPWDDEALSRNIATDVTDKEVQKALELARTFPRAGVWTGEQGAAAYALPDLPVYLPAPLPEQRLFRPHDPGDISERLKQVEEQLKRLEETLNRLADQEDDHRAHDAPEPPAPPGPPALPHDGSNRWEFRA